MSGIGRRAGRKSHGNYFKEHHRWIIGLPIRSFGSDTREGEIIGEAKENSYGGRRRARDQLPAA